MKNCEISVIVPVYNVAPYIEACAQSILAQTFPDFECILVDDGSTDGSGKLCDALARRDERIRVIHQENGGLSAARNAGLDAAAGRYIAFVDSDDLIAPHFLEVLYREIRRDNTRIAACRYVRFDDGSSCPPENLSDRTEQWPLRRSLMELCDPGMEERAAFVIVVWNKLYDSVLFNELRFQVGRLHEDEWIMHHLLVRAGGMRVCDAQLYFYRQRSSSITGSTSAIRRRTQDALDAYKERCDVLSGKIETDVYQRLVTRYFEMMAWHAMNFPELTALIRRRALREMFRYRRNLRAKRYAVFVLSPKLFRRMYWR